MSEPINPLHFNDYSSDYSDKHSDKHSENHGNDYFGLAEDDIYAPADLSEVSVGPCAISVRSLTNSPGAEPADLNGARPVRRARSVTTDAWSVPAPANWGRTRRMTESGRPATRRALRKVRTVTGRRTQATPSSEWSLPF